MGRPVILSVIVALLVCSPAVPSALGQTSPPRGLLTSTEYAQLLATQQAVDRRVQHGTATSIAQHDCKALTGVSRLTSTQHAECVASLLFFYHFGKFTPALVRCDKRSSSLSRQLGCIQRSDNDLYRFARGFIRTNSASDRAARQRGLTGQCLDYLVFTAPQSKAMNGLVAALRGLTRRIRTGNPDRIATAGKRVGTALRVTGNAFNTSGTVTVCRHQ